MAGAPAKRSFAGIENITCGSSRGKDEFFFPQNKCEHQTQQIFTGADKGFCDRGARRYGKHEWQYGRDSAHQECERGTILKSFGRMLPRENF